jgi:hypothetical protein
MNVAESGRKERSLVIDISLSPCPEEKKDTFFQIFNISPGYIPAGTCEPARRFCAVPELYDLPVITACNEYQHKI